MLLIKSVIRSPSNDEWLEDGATLANLPIPSPDMKSSDILEMLNESTTPQSALPPSPFRSSSPVSSLQQVSLLRDNLPLSGVPSMRFVICGLTLIFAKKKPRIWRLNL